MKLTDNEIWQPEKQYEYLAECAHKKNLTTAKALSDAAEVDPSFTSRFKTGNLKNPPLIPTVRLFLAANASLDTAFDINTDAKVSAEEIAELKEQLRESSRLNDEQKNKINQIEIELAQKDKLLEERQTALYFERKTSQRKSRYLSALTIILVILILVFICICIYDRLNPNVGWFRELYYRYNNASIGSTIINLLRG